MKRFAIAASLAVASLLVNPSANAASDYAKTHYPIVLVHGLFGFSQIGGAVDYFYQIPADLSTNGATVYTPAVSPVDSNEVRGEQLLSQVQTILAMTGAQKVNLVGHSQGGPTARYVAGVIPANVASVTTIAGVNKGTPVADIVLGLDTFGLTQPIVDSIVGAVAQLVGFASGTTYPANVQASMTSLSTAGSAAFNQKFPAGIPVTACGEGAYQANGQKFYSWTGTSQFTNALDPLDYLLVLASAAFLGVENDTLVGKCSSHFGKVLRDNYAWNHLDEVNQVLGLRGLFSADPVVVFREHANRLKLAGL